MAAASPQDMPERCRFAHLTWLDALDVADSVWKGSEDAREVRCLTLLREHLQREEDLVSQTAVTTTLGRAVVADELQEEWRHVLDGAVEAAKQSARGSRMAVEVSLELAMAGALAAHLEQVRRLLEDRIGSDPELAGVKVWRWTSQTGGRAYTDCAANGTWTSPPPAYDLSWLLTCVTPQPAVGASGQGLASVRSHLGRVGGGQG